MDLFGEFHKAEIDGKPYLVYQNVMKILPQIQTPNSKLAIHSGDDFLPQPLFLCPTFRIRKLWDSLGSYTMPKDGIHAKFETSPLFDDTSDGHHVLPLFWCNNKEANPEVHPEFHPEVQECEACQVQAIGTDYYFCVECDKRFHKECVESPLEISHPSHKVKHSLQLYFYLNNTSYHHCIYCRERATYRTYYCALCNSYMHTLCAQAKIPIFIDQPKRHDHTLTLFPRQASLTCNICGLVNRLYLTYVCAICNFVAHSDCIHIPQTIRISRHFHRVSFASSLPLGELSSSGVCRKEIDSDYGTYACNKCSDYAVHTRCALRKDIWDGIELEGEPEDEDVKPPFERIADGIILHGCHLEFETNNGVYDEEKFCQACVLPIYENNFYVCVECGFILHERCAEAPRKKYHPLHPHPLEQKVANLDGIFKCHSC